MVPGSGAMAMEFDDLPTYVLYMQDLKTFSTLFKLLPLSPDVSKDRMVCINYIVTTGYTSLHESIWFLVLMIITGEKEHKKSQKMAKSRELQQQSL